MQQKFIKEKKDNQNGFNFGRFDWKMKYPETKEEVLNSEDDQLIKWWRFLPPSLGNREKSIILSHITYEFKKRFKNPQNQVQQTNT